jgi:hypothetical protein
MHRLEVGYPNHLLTNTYLLAVERCFISYDTRFVDYANTGDNQCITTEVRKQRNRCFLGKKVCEMKMLSQVGEEIVFRRATSFFGVIVIGFAKLAWLNFICEW